MDSGVVVMYDVRQLKFNVRRGIVAALAAMVLLQTGCDDRDPDANGGPADTTADYDLSFRAPEFPEGRSLDTMFSVDLDDDGRREYVVASLERAGGVAPSARADLIEIYRFDTLSRSWRVVLSDTLLWAASYDLREITGDRTPEVIVRVDGGGNDPVATYGMHIYSGSGGTIRTIFNRDDGDPRIGTIDDGDEPVLIVTGMIWPPLVPHVQSVPYVADIVAFDGTSMSSVRSRHTEYFRRQADALLTAYAEDLKSARPADTQLIGDEGLAGADIPDGSLFATTAQAIIALDQAGQTSTLRTFWNRERDTLRAVLPGEQFDQLEELYAETIMR